MSAPIHPIQSPPPFPLSKLLIGLVSGLVLLNLSVFLFSQHRNLPVPIPSEPPSDATDPGPAIDLAQLDMERIHASLLPQWALARVGGEPTSIIPLHEELLEALQAEPTLTEIIHALEKSSEVPAVTTASLVIPLCWAWNQHLDAHSAPWRIRCHMVQREGDHWFYLSSYQVLADVQIQVEEKPQRVRLLRRMDRTGAREPYLGHTGTQEEGALLVLDRIRDFAMDSIWPLLNPDTDPRLNALSAALAPQVRSEVRRSIGSDHLQVLTRTAEYRFEMLKIWSELEPVRRCLELEHLRLPWSGATEETLLPFSSTSQVDGPECPRPSPDQLGQLLQLTERIAEEPQLLPALDHLVAWAAHPITVHEARHLADRTRDGAQGPPCPGCQTPLSAPARSELSAYLSTMTHPSLSSTARLQACEALAQLPEDSPHSQALREIQAQGLESMCSESLPDFIRRSRTAMARLLGRSPTSQLPPDFPRRLPVALEPPEPETRP